MKKTYLLRGTEIVYVTSWVESDKSPEEFESLEDFWKYADKGYYSTDSVVEPVWEEVEDIDE
jgi:hypothetical protein